MATRGKNRKPMPLPGRSEPSDSGPPPLPARRPPPPVPQTVTNEAEETTSDEDDSYEEPSAKREEESQELYDDFNEVDDPPPISPYNPTTNQPQEIYDEFEEVQEEVYEDPDESPAPPPKPSSSGNPPPLPPLDNRKRGSLPLPTPPVQKPRDLPPPPQDETPNDYNDGDIYEAADEFSEEEDNPAPPPPPLPTGRGPKPPTPARKTEEKPKAPKGIGAIGVMLESDIKGALKGLRKVSTGEKTVDDKNMKNEKNKNAKEALPFGEKKTYFDGKGKETGFLAEDHHSNGDKNNNSRPLPPVKDSKPKPPPLVPKLPAQEVETNNASNVSKISAKFGGVQSLIADQLKKPDPPVKPQPTPKPAIRSMAQTENGGVKTVQLPPRIKAKLTKPEKGTAEKDKKAMSPTADLNGPPLPPRPESDTPEENDLHSNTPTKSPRKPPPPAEEEFPPPPDFDEDDQEIYDDAFSQDLDPLDKFRWYHGKLERKEGERLLKNIGKDGTFLVRKSTKGQDQPYTMAVLYQDRVNNLKIRLREDKRIALGESKPNEISFKDVEGMIEHHRKHPVLLIGTQKGEITLQSSPAKS